ncbi:Crp/Fnr family transcriptional regulator [Anaeromyxobacter oryzisoli]|jgi:CRP-like cAMP-binding protein|uniref:Crp/Fnr family transcriptional regulator n=1 Tax=Anaeromyxobacter oryzisoli TaxID=2925408 RepID=UPI001F58ED56|nr:cyclic nucleotide-binding domain-containing protein [Anaeromyxobacter sp. SG63]
MASAPREVLGDLATTAFVESSLLFRSLDPEARHDLLQLAQQATWAAGEAISGEGDEGFYLVLDGRAVATAGGVEVAQLERGAFFGEGRVLGTGRSAALVAGTDVSAVIFPAPVVAALGARFPKVRKLLEAVHAAREKDASGQRVP